MSTQSWSTRIRHDSDAVWQEWRDEFITKLNALGSPLVADETNITPGAGARPGTNTEGGYAVYHLGDSLHGTAPIYIRFGFGTGSNANAPRIQVGVGTATDGSGNLSGIGSAGNHLVHTPTIGQTTDTARQSYMCANDGFFGFQWKVGSGNNTGTFLICRTCNSSGAITATGAIGHWADASSSSFTRRQSYRYAATAIAYTHNTGNSAGLFGFSAQSPTSTQVGADVQAMMAYTITPRVEPLAFICGVYPTEAAEGSTFSVAMVGSTPRTFLVLDDLGGAFGPVASGSAGYLAIAMLWE